MADYQGDLAAGHFELGAVLFDIGRFDQAEAAYRQALATQTKLAADHPVVAEYRRARRNPERSGQVVRSCGPV